MAVRVASFLGTPATKQTCMRASATGMMTQRRSFHRSLAPQFKACVVGAAGGIGQPLSLLLKNDPLVTDLRVYDLAPITPGVAADLSHINTPAKVTLIY